MKITKITQTLAGLTFAAVLTFSAGFEQVMANTLPASSAPIKIGVIDLAQVFAVSPKAKAIGEKLKKEFQTRESNMISADKSMKEKETKLERNGSIMSEAERSKLEKEIHNARRDLGRVQAELREDATLRQREETSKFFKQIQVIIKDIAQAEKYNLILTAESAPYSDNRVNITDKVIKKLNEKI